MSDAPLIPYQGRDDIAYVNRELATKRDSLKEKGDLFRVTDMYVSRYGILGYVEMNTTVKEIGGCLEIPDKLVKSMRNVPGMIGYISEVVFGKDEDFTKTYGLENLSHPSLEGFLLFDSEYYWYPYPGYLRIEPSKVNESIKSLEEGVIDFITKFDKELDKFIPENRRPNYSSLIMLGPGQLEQSAE